MESGAEYEHGWNWQLFMTICQLNADGRSSSTFIAASRDKPRLHSYV